MTEREREKKKKWDICRLKSYQPLQTYTFYLESDYKKANCKRERQWIAKGWGQEIRVNINKCDNDIAVILSKKSKYLLKYTLINLLIKW